MDPTEGRISPLEINLLNIRTIVYSSHVLHCLNQSSFPWWCFVILHDAWGMFDIVFLFTASFDGEKHAINLPSVNSASFVLRFLEKLCHSLQCDNLFSSQPFSPYMGCAHSPTEYDRNKPGTIKQLLFSSTVVFEKRGDFVEFNFLICLAITWIVQFVVNSFQSARALTGWDSSYHMCRNHFVQQILPCSQTRKHMYVVCITGLLLREQAQNFTFHLFNFCLNHKISLQKNTHCLIRRGLLWQVIEFSPSHNRKKSFLPSSFVLLSGSSKILNSSTYCLVF